MRGDVEVTAFFFFAFFAQFSVRAEGAVVDADLSTRCAAAKKGFDGCQIGATFVDPVEVAVFAVEDEELPVPSSTATESWVPKLPTGSADSSIAPDLFVFVVRRRTDDAVQIKDVDPFFRHRRWRTSLSRTASTAIPVPWPLEPASVRRTRRFPSAAEVYWHI